MLEALGGIGGVDTRALTFLANSVAAGERWMKEHGGGPGLDSGLEHSATAIARGGSALERRLAGRLRELKFKAKAETSMKLPIYPGEAWSDVAIAEVNAMADEKK